MKKILLFMIAFSIILTFNGCNSEEVNPEDIKCIYNGHEYVDYDNNNRFVTSTWSIPEKYKYEKVKIYLGELDSKDRKPRNKGIVYNDEQLNMFLGIGDLLFCNKDYVFPDYRDTDRIEKIILIPSDEICDFDDDSCIIITDKNDIENIVNRFSQASLQNNKAKCVAEKAATNDVFIGIKFSKIGALFELGYISVDINGNYGLMSIDIENSNLLYPLGDTKDILDKYGRWYIEYE